ncbi:MAG: TetR/AcrR family transcriptional regulator [Pseudomonas sp.]
MARPKSEDKRHAILDSALQIFAEQGLGAATAKIAKGAGVAEGTLFNYFATKDELLNQLYLEIKAELSEVMLPGFPRGESVKHRMRHLWHTYVDWGVAFPHKRKVTALLSMSDRITPQTQAISAHTMADISQTMQHGIDSGTFREQPPAFIAAIMRSLAETTMDFMSNEPEQAQRYREAGFEAYWNSIAAN